MGGFFSRGGRRSSRRESENAGDTSLKKKRLNYFKIVDENKIKNILFEMRTVSLTFT